jgi:methyl-accepting chemotaxis protein|nr:PAS domain-containing protein [uncultured Campylobacter sp.]
MGENSKKEHQVSADAFLVSKTDVKGKITYCNVPFANIVGAKSEELIGKPHNIVRHPDMPKIVFQILWKYVKDKREVFAYVKNRSFDGGFYWVFANVTPSYDQNGNIIGYYSVRRKPNPKALEIIAPLYERLLNAEKNGGMEASGKILEQILDDKKVSYDELMNELQRL